MKRFTLLLMLTLALIGTGCAAEMEAPCPEEETSCVICHTDKDMLIVTAAPEEPEAEVEAAGEG